MQSRKHSILKRMVSTTMIFTFLSFAFMACDKNRFYEHNEAIGDHTWRIKDAKQFEVEIKDSVHAYNFYINVRNTVDYEYANLYFFIESELPDGIIAKDTVECQLADYQGKWLGDGRGEYRDNRFILRQNMRFKKAGTYRFKLQHGMRSDSFKGIADVGIRLEKLKY